MKLNFVSFILIGLTLVLISCSSTKRSATTDISFEDMSQLMKSNFEKINSYSGSGDINLDFSDLKMTFQFSIETIKPRTSLLNVFGPFGFEIATIFLKNDSLLIFSALKNEVIKTNLFSSKLIKNQNLKLFYGLLQPFLFGYFNLEQLEADSLSYSNTKDKMCVTKYSKDTQIGFCFDKSQLFLSELSYYKNSANEELRIYLNNLKQIDGIKFPMNIVVNNLKTNETLSISFKKIQFNHLKEELQFLYPKDAEVKEW